MTTIEACAIIVGLLATNRELRQRLDAALLLAERQAAGWGESVERNRDTYARLYRAERALGERRKRDSWKAA